MKLQSGDRVGILTSGGDAPGMNAALRASARVGRALGLEVVGVEEGYRGLIDGRVVALDLHTLDEAARRGGTILGSARSKVFPTAEGQARARETIVRERLRALVVIGGNGSLTGARTLEGCEAAGGRLAVAGLPASIDNDLAGTSLAIGVDTAMNTIVEALDRLSDTATAHRRTFIVEVMGRDSGYLAMTSAIAGGADAVLLPEAGKTEDQLVDQVVRAMEAAYGRDRGKRRVLVVKSEGVKIDSVSLKTQVDARIAQSLPDVDTRVTVLGHLVRGGAPTALDRMLAQRLANVAMRALTDGESGFMAGWSGPVVKRAACAYDPHVVITPIEEVLAETARLHAGDLEVARWRKRIFEEAESILLR